MYSQLISLAGMEKTSKFDDKTTGEASCKNAKIQVG